MGEYDGGRRYLGQGGVCTEALFNVGETDDGLKLILVRVGPKRIHGCNRVSTGAGRWRTAELERGSGTFRGKNNGPVDPTRFDLGLEGRSVSRLLGEVERLEWGCTWWWYLVFLLRWEASRKNWSTGVKASYYMVSTEHHEWVSTEQRVGRNRST